MEWLTSSRYFIALDDRCMLCGLGFLMTFSTPGHCCVFVCCAIVEASVPADATCFPQLSQAIMRCPFKSFEGLELNLNFRYEHFVPHVDSGRLLMS